MSHEPDPESVGGRIVRHHPAVSTVSYELQRKSLPGISRAEHLPAVMLGVLNTLDRLVDEQHVVVRAAAFAACDQLRDSLIHLVGQLDRSLSMPASSHLTSSMRASIPM